LFLSILSHALQRAQKYDRHIALLLIELDHFGLTNELQAASCTNLIYSVQAARVKSALCWWIRSLPWRLLRRSRRKCSQRCRCRSW
jgi:hypothetical protein